jgi:hypothetical protein
MVAAAKDAVDSKGILASGRNDSWLKLAFSAAWEVVMETFYRSLINYIGI